MVGKTERRRARPKDPTGHLAAPGIDKRACATRADSSAGGMRARREQRERMARAEGSVWREQRGVYGASRLSGWLDALRG
jgi:hypothetical protein